MSTHPLISAPLARLGLSPEQRQRKRLRPLDDVPTGSIKVHEIFASVQGESSYAGLPCTFVRTTACHLRCSYCDTPHAFGRGQSLTLAQVVARVQALGPRLVELTGGEPLLQPTVLPLMTQLCDLGFEVLCETSGTVCIGGIDPRVVKVMDLKAPSSGEVGANLWSNLERLSRHDEVKFVVGDRADYLWARQVIDRHQLARRCSVLMGTVWGRLPPAELVEWVLADRLPVRVQLQLHKYIWHPDRTGV